MWMQRHSQRPRSAQMERKNARQKESQGSGELVCRSFPPWTGFHTSFRRFPLLQRSTASASVYRSSNERSLESGRLDFRQSLSCSSPAAAQTEASGCLPPDIHCHANSSTRGSQPLLGSVVADMRNR